MLSSLSSFIPHSLLPGSEPSHVEADHHHPAGDMAQINDQQVGKKKTKEKGITTETFIVVRPPPSKTNHPLNLQLQMVLPSQTRDRMARRSIDFNNSSETLPESSEPASFSPLERTPSTRSNRSNRSSTESIYSSVVSMGSVVSLSSTTGGTRRIIPLYNLSAHNVMANTILDAGTDAKVAKFYKRGLEIIDLGFLEPIEVWGHAELYPVNSKGSANLIVRPPELPELPPSVTVPPPVPGGAAKKLFGKLFKKKEVPPPAAVPSPSQTPQPAIITTPAPPVEPLLQPPVLGIQPQLRANSYPPVGRPTSYVWVVRKWIKGTGDGWLGGLGNVGDHLGGALGMNTLGAGAQKRRPGETEVRFEWVRGKRTSLKKRKAQLESRREGQLETRRDSITPGGLDIPASTNTTMSSRHSKRHSAIPTQVSNSSLSSHVTGSAHNTPSSTLQRNASQDRRHSLHYIPPNPRAESPNPISSTTNSDEGDESDPEDSETPWNCSVHVETDHSHIKLRLGSLAPAPHHPKVVAQIKTPYPLPDVEVDRCTIRKRERGGCGNGATTVPAGLVMTAEEMKDVMSSTGLWLIVRESFGGIGNKRKGDGWNIRG